ncbi:MAG: tripartite tricarboxylate transporter substrate binding protein [Betaproteobacteria bacterium]|nr:MAG: tripartite tricarboxylate transporter substrate binding protein [Betaproteobacteria bacterium]
MKISKDRAGRAGLVAAVAVFGFAAPVGAQPAYPVKPIRVITPYGPGGTTDILSRMVGPKLTESWGQQVIVDNRPGGNTVIGSEALVKSAPDGYTLICILTSHVIVPNLVSTPYDAVKDFAAVATIAKTQLVLVTHPSVPVKTVKELIAFAKSKSGELNYGSGGSGTVTHLAGEYFNMLAGVKIQHIPYKGSAQALTDLIGGQVHMYYSPPIVALPHIKSRRLHAIAVTGDARLDVLPQAPTIQEAGLKGFEIKIWYGMLAPAATPRPIIDKLGADIGKVLVMPDIRDRLVSQGMEPFVSTPDQFAALVKADFAKYAKIIKTANIKLQQ